MKTTCRVLIGYISLSVLSCLRPAAADEVVVRVDAQKVLGPISRYLTGACIEDVNHEIYGGIYSQMVFGESFQEPFEPQPLDHGPVSGQWRPTARGDAQGRFALPTDRPFIGEQSQQVELVSGDGEIGIENRGLNRQGMCFQASKPYDGYVWARAEKPTDLWLTLEDGKGTRRVAETRLQVAGGDEWQRLDFKLIADADIDGGRLAISLRQPGRVVLGHAFMQPGEWGRFQSLPDRRDVVEGLVEQGLTVLRYGGSMINHSEYRWKKMIGPRDRRPPNQGTWYRYSTNGWGIFDFLHLCEASGFLAIPAVNMGESPQDMADFVEYVNGPPDSNWGKRRAEDGHSKPYGLRYLELGNEERIDEAYFDRFRALAEAIWSKDREMVLVVGDFVYDHVIDDPAHITGAASRISNLDGHRKLLQLAKEAGREIAFDVHIGTDGPHPSGSLRALASYVAALEKLADGAKHQVVVFEFNSGNHAFRRALGNAGAINAIERLAGRVTIAASANCLQVDGQNDNDWNQGLLFMNPCHVWPQPPYFVTQMVARHYLPLAVKAEVAGAARLDVSAKRSDDGHSLVLQVVNTHDQPIAAQLDLAGFVPRKPAAQVEELAAALEAVNTASAPTIVRPTQKEWQHGIGGEPPRYTFPAMSFTVMRFD